LSNYGPESTGDRIVIKKREGQQTAISKSNITVKSFSGEHNCLNSFSSLMPQSIEPILGIGGGGIK